jgi:hypothetical protein
MNLAGLPLATLGAIFGVVAGLTVLLYILKLRRRPVPVPFSRLWQRVLRDQESNQLFSRLRRLLSLLLQLALLLLLVLALGDPRFTRSSETGRSIVVLVDASASMKSRDVDADGADPEEIANGGSGSGGEPDSWSGTRLGAARARLLDLVRGLGGSDRMLVAQMDATLTPLSTMTSELSELTHAAERLKPSDTVADLSRGLAFALDSLRGRSSPEILLLSDGAFDDFEAVKKRHDLSGVTLSYEPFGKKADNVAITQFSVRRYPLDRSRYEVMIELSNTNSQAVEVELSLYGDDQLVDVSRVLLSENEVLPRFYSDLAGASQTLEARIKPVAQERDVLDADNHAFALMPERRRVRVLTVTRGNTYLEAALLLDEYLDVTQLGPDDPLPSGAFDVAVLDGVAPELPRGVEAALYLNPPSKKDVATAPLDHRAEIEEFGFDVWDKKSPLLRFMAIENVQALRGNAFSPDKGDAIIGASDHGPILVSGKRAAGRPFVALGFDPRDSDLVLRVAWPIFLMNTIHSFVEEKSAYISSYQTGRVWRLPAPASADTVWLEGPSGDSQKLAVKEGRAAFFGSDAGFYELRSAAPEDAPVLSRFAGNFAEPTESRVEPMLELDFTGAPAPRATGFDHRSRSEIWVYLLLVAVALSALEWITYHRRVTV